MCYPYTMADRDYMKMALRLAAKARGGTSPNPMVGAVLVKNGKILASDYHKKAGAPHAEALVIQSALDKARGATLYVTLEPCCHTDKRTPPCTAAIIDAGIRKVVVAMQDPNPKVSGKGIKTLRNQGIEVTAGVMEHEARELNRAYIKYITTKTPYVILKTATTLDGKIATPEGSSKWITSERSRRVVWRTRSSLDAVLTAIGTVNADDPELTARIRGGRDPIRIVIDPDLRISPDARICKMPPKTVIVTRTGGSKAAALEARGIALIRYEGQLSMRWLMARLGERGITSLLVEGGSSLNSHALMEGVVDSVMVFIAPKIIGGKDSLTSVGGRAFRELSDAIQIENMKIRRIGVDILIEGDVRDPLKT